MANKKLGFIKLYRSLLEHWIWNSDTPFDDRSAWVDLLLMVNHEDKQIQIGRDIVTIHAGQTWTSYVKLSNRWKWSKERVYRYTKMLKKAGMIQVDATTNGTLLTLVNYSNFASQRNANETANETTNETPSKTSNETSDETQTRSIKNIKNDKEIKEEKASLFSPPPFHGGEWQ